MRSPVLSFPGANANPFPTQVPVTTQPTGASPLGQQAQRVPPKAISIQVRLLSRTSAEWASLGSSKTYRLQSRPPEQASLFCLGSWTLLPTGSLESSGLCVASDVSVWSSDYFVST